MDHYLPEEPHRCTAPRDQCVMNGNYEFYVHNLVPRDPASIKFKTIPFHRITNQVVPPMNIDFAPIIAVAGADNVCNLVGAKFYLSLSDVQRICPPNRVPDNRKQASQLQIRIGKRLSGISELSEELPQRIFMRINGKEIPMDDVKSPLYVNAIDYLHLNTVQANTITLFWPPCSIKYYMVVNLVDIISVEELVEDIKTDNDRFFLTLDTKKTATELLRKAGKDLGFMTHKLTLLCPINKSKMNLPAKSVKCDHLQCFDLQAFISSNKIKPTWVCPICKNPCILADLKIDSFLSFIINSVNLPKTCEEIELDENGRWKPCILNSDSREGVSATSWCPIEKTIFEMNSANLDKESLDVFVKTELPITSAGNSNELKPNICMNTAINILKTKTEENPPLLKIIKEEDPLLLKIIKEEDPTLLKFIKKEDPPLLKIIKEEDTPRFNIINTESHRILTIIKQEDLPLSKIMKKEDPPLLKIIKKEDNYD